MDVHALVAPLGAQREGICNSPSILPEVSGYHTGGMIWRKPLFLPLQHTGGHGFKPRDGQQLFWHKNQLLTWRDGIYAHADFPISLTSNTTCALLPRSFLSALPSSPWICKQVESCTYHVPNKLSYLSVISSSHKPRLGNFPARASFVGTKNSYKTLFIITLSALPSLHFDLLVCWVGNS